MNSKLVHQPMVTDEPNNEIVNSDIPPLSDHMNISLAFKKIMSEDPPRYTELCEAVNKTFEEISDSISLEEFKNILRDISFSKNKKNLTNLLSVLKSQFYEHMSKNFEQLLKEENVSELFSKKKLLTEEETKKYLIDKESIELYELEESLSQLNVQISQLEQANEVLFNQGNFNQQRYDKLDKRITKIMNESKIKFQTSQEVKDLVQIELMKLINNT